MKAYEEDVLMMVMNDSRYGDTIPFAFVPSRPMLPWK